MASTASARPARTFRCPTSAAADDGLRQSFQDQRKDPTGDILNHAPTRARPARHRSPANQYRHDDLPLSARVADRVTAVFGSWAFIITQTVLIIIWLSYNGYVAIHYLRGGAFDPYPFILLNLLFSTQAAYAAPLILLSQNRTAETDRIKAEHDFDVNVLALRSLAELLGDVHDQKAQTALLRRIDDLLGTDAERPADARPNAADTARPPT